MSKKTFIIANWKCNPTTKKEADRIFKTVKEGINKTKKTQVVFCPPFVWIPSLISSENSGYALGAQNCHWENRGTFTGEVSPLMLKDLGCKYVIVGHSERRNYFGETDEIINRKIKTILKSNLIPILCIGEKEREDNEMGLIVEKQLKKDLDGILKSKIKDIIIAYEPIWAISKGAIGSGKPCLPDDAVKASLFIKKTLMTLYNRSTADKAVILYGGSVNSQNIFDYVKEESINGVLVGGASLQANDFIKIVKKTEEL
ncbi:triose-phosphate isomerase [Patescibacteria group bacterium]